MNLFFTKSTKKILKRFLPLRLLPYKHIPDAIALHKYKAAYVIVPKVACTSLQNYFADVLFGKEKKKELIENIKYGKDIHDLRFPSIDRERLQKGCKYFKFCFVRNPWDRLVSCYVDKIQLKTPADPEYNNGVRIWLNKSFRCQTGELDFENFVEKITKISPELGERHFKPQSCYITTKEGNLFVDFIGKFETLQDDFNLLCAKINLSPRRLGHFFLTKRPHYSSFYSESTKKLVEKYYESDIRLFNYKFERVSE